MIWCAEDDWSILDRPLDTLQKLLLTRNLR